MMRSGKVVLDEPALEVDIATLHDPGIGSTGQALR